MRLLIIICILCAIIILMQCRPSSSSSTHAAQDYVHITGEQVTELIKDHPDMVILDVRTPEEHQSGKIIGSQNINFFDDDFKEQVDALDKSKKYLIHCRSGGRSTKAANIMKEMGFTDLVHLDGGYRGYMDSKKSN